MVKAMPQLAPAPRRSRLKMIIVIVVAGLLIGVAGLVGWLVFQSRAVDYYYVKGNNHYDRALLDIDQGLNQLLDTKVTRDVGGLDRTAKSIDKKLKSAQNQLKAADRAFVRMRQSALTSSEKKTADFMRQSIRQASQGTRVFKSDIKDVSKLAAALAKIDKAADSFDKGFIAVNEAITDANENKFDEAVKKAEKADRLFKKVQSLLNDADKIVEDRVFVAAIAAVSKGREWAVSAAKLAESGRANEVAGYNQLVETNNELSDEVAVVGRTSILADPSAWFNDALDESAEKITYFYNQADRLREQALLEWQPVL